MINNLALRAVAATIAWTLLAAGCGSDDGPGPSDAADAADAADAPAPTGDGGSPDRPGDGAPAPTDGGGPGDAAAGTDGPMAADAPADVPPLAAPGPLFCGRPGLVFSGQEHTIDVFPTQDGLILVRERSLLLIDRTGKLRRTVTLERDATAAAFDGTTLVVADRAMLLRFRVDLQPIGRRLLRDQCDSTLVVPGRGIYCGGGGINNDRAIRVAYPDDPSAATTLVGEGSLTSMRPVPGRPHFVGPGYNGFLYHAPGADGRFNSRGNNFRPSGEVKGGAFFAFAGNPATHVVDLAGNLLTIPEAACTIPAGMSDNGCFVSDGNLGTLMTNQSFLGLVEDGPGTVLALARQNPSNFEPYGTPPCLMGCNVQRIDVAGKKLLGQRMHRLDARIIKRLKVDPFCDRMLVLSRTSEDPPLLSPGETGGDYRVHLLDHGDSTHPVDPPAGFDPAPTVDPGPPPPPPDTTTACAPAGPLYQGADPPIAVHPTAEGVVVATAKAVSLFGRDGKMKATVPATGTNTAVAFDGTRLVVADDQPGLTQLAPATLAAASARMPTPEPCGGLVLMGGARAVCGGAKDFNRMFYTLDLDTRAEVTRTTPFQIGGLAMQRIPGKPQFISFGSSSAFDYMLMEVAPSGAVTVVNPMQYSINSLGPNVAFLGNPAEQLVAVSGALATIQGADCPATGPMPRHNCFARNGQLGVRSPAAHLGVATDPAGAVYLLGVAERYVSGGDNRCGGDCVMQKVDVATRRVVSQRPARLVVREPRGAVFDPHCGYVLFSYMSTWPTYGAPTYRVDAVDFRPEVTP